MDLRSIENWHFTILIHLRPRDKHIPLRRRDIGCDKKSWSKNLPNISIVVRIFFFSLSLSFVYLLTLRRSSKGICIIFNIVSSILFNHHRALMWCEKHRESVFFSTIVIFWEECIWYGVYNNSLYIYIYSRVVIAKTMITITGFDILSILSLLPGASSIIYDFVYSPSTDRIAVKHGVMHIEDVVRGLKERETERCIPRHWVTWWTFFFFFFFLLPSLRINDRDRLYTHACAIVSRIKKIVDR